MVDSEIDLIRPFLREISPLLRDLDEIILDYVRLLLVGQYKRGDFRNISNGTYTFMVNMKIKILAEPEPGLGVKIVNLSYEGEIDVTRDDNWLIFKFSIKGVGFELINGILYNDIFRYNGVLCPYMTFPPHTIEDLLPRCVWTPCYKIAFLPISLNCKN